MVVGWAQSQPWLPNRGAVPVRVVAALKLNTDRLCRRLDVTHSERNPRVPRAPALAATPLRPREASHKGRRLAHGAETLGVWSGVMTPVKPASL